MLAGSRLGKRKLLRRFGETVQFINRKKSDESDIALAFIAFGVGKFFKKDVLMKTGWKVVTVTLWESLLAGLLTFSVVVAVINAGSSGHIRIMDVRIRSCSVRWIVLRLLCFSCFSFFLFRIIGKYGGMYLGCVLTKMPASHRNYMGLALIPQAGVAIGLAFLGQRLLPAEIGNLLLTIILSSSVLYELVGPASAKLSFFLSGTIKRETKPKADRNTGKEKVKKYPGKNRLRMRGKL